MLALRSADHAFEIYFLNSLCVLVSSFLLSEWFWNMHAIITRNFKVSFPIPMQLFDNNKLIFFMMVMISFDVVFDVLQISNGSGAPHLCSVLNYELSRISICYMNCSFFQKHRAYHMYKKSHWSDVGRHICLTIFLNHIGHLFL